MRYFKKELPSNPLFLPNGKQVRFRTAPSGVGLLATNNEPLMVEFDKILKRSLCGLIEVTQEEFQDLLRPQYDRPEASSEERPDIDQLYATWRLGRGRLAFKPKDSKIRTVGRFIHVTERHPQSSQDSHRRVMTAFWSWVDQYECGMIPCHVWTYKRSAKQIGDSRELPYLKDILEEALKIGNKRDDVIVLSNDDTILHASILPVLADMLNQVDVISSFRLNFEKGKVPTPTTPINKIRRCGIPCLGRDLFAVRSQWLRLNWDSIPDFVLGEAEWDLVLAAMARLSVGVTCTKQNRDLPQPRCELERGYVIHEIHERSWTNEKFARAPAKIHNNRLAGEWYADNDLMTLIGDVIC